MYNTNHQYDAPRPCTVGQQGTQVYMSANNETFVYDVRQQPIGGGAMGTVFRGTSLRDGRPVAIKMVNPQYASIPSVRRRARQEADLQFRHPHLIEMLGCCDYGTMQGPMFIVSNFVNGITLNEHVERNLSNFADRTERVCRSIFPVLDALGYLHEKGVYHLDIKPSNIMVEKGHSNIRLMDLGISNTRGVEEITSAGLLGTPGYAAPEQYVEPGIPMRIDARTDLYELGITLYELLAGEKPDPERVAPIRGVSPRVINVIRRAIAQDPDARYASAAEMRSALEEALMPQTSSALPKILAIVGVAILLILIIAALIGALSFLL